VGVPAVAEGLDAGVFSERDVQPAFNAGAVKLGEMAASEVVGDVRRRKKDI
jgi:hypothetical protein